jgi:hypothetical protein
MIDKIFQLFLALGSPAFEGLMTRLGGPKVVFGEPYIDNRPFVKSIASTPEFQEYIPSGGTVPPSYLEVMRKQERISQDEYTNWYYIHIPIFNRQRSRIPNSTAVKVFAKLAFTDLKGTPISKKAEFDARWENTRQPSAFENYEGLRFIDILPDDSQNLNIATRRIRGGCWFVMNNDSYKDNEYPDNALREEGFIFRLRLSGSNIFEKSIRYQFHSVGKGGKPEFIKLEN